MLAGSAATSWIARHATAYGRLELEQLFRVIRHFGSQVRKRGATVCHALSPDDDRGTRGKFDEQPAGATNSETETRPRCCRSQRPWYLPWSVTWLGDACPCARHGHNGGWRRGQHRPSGSALGLAAYLHSGWRAAGCLAPVRRRRQQRRQQQRQRFTRQQ